MISERIEGAAMRQAGWNRIAAGALTLLLATGCSFNVSLGGGAVDKDEVAKRASAQLAKQVGQTPDDLTCAEDLPAKVGATIRCELTEGADTLGVTITTTSVDGSNVQFDIKVDDAPSN